VFDASTGNMVLPDVSINNGTGAVVLTFGSPPAVNAYRVVIMG
jgi:hypothetical protein